MTDETRCAACGRPFQPGQLKREVNTPQGPTQIHDRCLRSHLRPAPDPEPGPRAGG